jgi:hypothetical protein
MNDMSISKITEFIIDILKEVEEFKKEAKQIF